jgi:hypothetical protein
LLPTCFKFRLLSYRRPTAHRLVVTAAGFNINKALDKAHESKLFKDVIKLPPSALQGLTPEADATLSDLKIHTIEDLSKWKFFRAAKAIVHLAAVEEAGQDGVHKANINKILKKDYEGKHLSDLAAAPVAALQGLTAAKYEPYAERIKGCVSKVLLPLD